MKLSIVLSTHTTRFDALAYSGDFARNVQRIAELGYDGVELAVRDPGLLDVDVVSEIVTQAGLDVPAIGTGQAYVEEGLSFTSSDPAIRAGAIARIQAQVDFAKHLGAQVIIGLLRGKLDQGIGRAQAVEWLIAALRECANRILHLLSGHNVRELLNDYVQASYRDGKVQMFTLEKSSVETRLHAPCKCKLRFAHLAPQRRGPGHKKHTLAFF